MTTQQLIDRVKNLMRYDLDGYFGSLDDVTNADVVMAMNDALIEIGKAAFIVHPMVTLTLSADQPFYDLRNSAVVNRRCVQVFAVIIGGNRLRTRRGDAYGMWSRSELERDHPLWLTDSSGTPTKAVMYSAQRMALHKAPDSTTVALGSHYLEAQILPPALSASNLSASPEMEEELHESLALLTAAKAADPNATEGHQNERIARMVQLALGKALEVGRQNRNMFTSQGTTWREGDDLMLA